MPADASANGSDRRDIGVAPRGLMDEQPLLPRRGLQVGAIGQGAAKRRYRLLAPIDRGGMGELFLAELTEPDKPSAYVVLKRLLADLLDDDKYVSMFHSEAEVMSKLDHDNIVRVFDTPVVDGAPCIAMQFVRGRNVQQILQRHEELKTKMPPGIVLRIMAEVLDGLSYAHTFKLPDGTPLNLVHRDVTPGNVLVSFDGDVKLTDFGIAKSQMSAVSTTVGIVKGKARYLSPEQILGEAATPPSDIFSAASVICEMLSGIPTFDRASVPKTLYAIVNGNRADLEEQLGFRAPLLVQVLDRALASDPKRRMQTAAEFRQGIEAASQLIGGRRVERADVGAYLSELFKDVEDPLANYENAPLGIASPGDIPKATAAEVATVHGYRPAAPTNPNQRNRPTEVIRRPAQDGPAGPKIDDLLEQAKTEGIGQIRAVPPMPPVELVLDDDPSIPSAEAIAIAAESAHGAGPTQIVRGTPIDHRDDSAPPSASSPNESVDEALSVLAWLQSRQSAEAAQAAQASTSTPDAPVAKPTAPAPRAASRVDNEPLPNLKGGKGPLIAVFVGGLLAGVLLTLVSQSFTEPPPESAPAAAEPIARVESTETTEEEVVEAPVTEVEPPAPTDPRPTLEVAPIELVAPPPVARPALLDVLHPRGARVRVDGRLLKKRVPIMGLELEAGEHTIRVFKRRYKKVVSFTAAGGETYELAKTLVKQPAAPE